MTFVVSFSTRFLDGTELCQFLRFAYLLLHDVVKFLSSFLSQFLQFCPHIWLSMSNQFHRLYLVIRRDLPSITMSKIRICIVRRTFYKRKTIFYTSRLKHLRKFWKIYLPSTYWINAENVMITSITKPSQYGHKIANIKLQVTLIKCALLWTVCSSIV